LDPGSEDVKDDHGTISPAPAEQLREQPIWLPRKRVRRPSEYSEKSSERIAARMAHMTDPDFASFGEPNRSRPEGYRLTHPRDEPATGSANSLTGFDPGRGSLGRPDVSVGWTPADPAPEWATGASPSVPPAPELPGSTGEQTYSRSESLMSAPDSVAIRPDFGTKISDSVAIRRQSENSTGAGAAQSPSEPADSEFSAFGTPAAAESGGALPMRKTSQPDTAASAPNTSNIPSPATEFGTPPAPVPADPAIDSAFRIAPEPPAESAGLPRRTPGLPHRFTDSDESDYAYSQPIVNLLDSQFDSPSARRKSGGLTNGSSYASAESGHLTNNSLLATAERESGAPADARSNSAEFGTRTGTPGPAPAQLPERPEPAPTPEANSPAPDPDTTTTGASAERASRTRSTSGFTAPADAVEPPPALPRSRMSRKAAERAAAEAASASTPDEETPSSTTESGHNATRRTATPARAATEARRTPPQDDVTKNVDVHLIMHLLMASHTLENLADKAETGDVSLEEFIRAARRTRTAAVDLVSAWFGGATQMRQFAEALLAASESA
jgi:hypothetical protein